MNKNLRAPILTVLGIASLAIAVPLSIANAQDQPPAGRAQQERLGQRTQGPGQPGGQFGQGQQGQPGQDQMGMMQRMGGGATPVMIDDQHNLYILAGNRVFKVSKETFVVSGQATLPMGGGPGGPGGPGGGFDGPPQPGQPGVRSGGRGGGELSLPGDPIPPTE